MEKLFGSRSEDRLILNNNWGWLLLLGVALVVLGIVAISAATWTTLLSVIFLGFLIFLSGMVILVDAFTNWWRKEHGFFQHFLLGVLYGVAGILLLNNPYLGSISITLVLGIFYLFIGIVRVFYSVSSRYLIWKWSLFNGIISLILGLLILANWPASSLFILGLFIGIDLLFAGWAYILMALTARSLLK